MVKDDFIIKVAVTGNTLLTLKSMEQILKSTRCEIVCVFGLSEEKLKHKTNSIDLTKFCDDNNIVLDQSEDWDKFYNLCVELGVEKVITLGDSRIIPKQIINSFDTIGNHGAILPDVQGGASLVWGRMLNSGQWGISIMKINERVDSGDILKIKKFNYNSNTTEEEFTTIADDLTVDALIEVLRGDYLVKKNEKWNVRLSKHVDSYKAINILKYCQENNLPIYMPPRTPKDGIIKQVWPQEFIDVFKVANNTPYPKWSEE